MDNYMKCDGCGTMEYTPTNRFVEVRVRRPSDPTDLCCIIAGCEGCFPGNRTPDEWEDYIESPEAIREGYMFLT